MMKRAILLGVVLASLAASAQAATAIHLSNKSSVDIDHLYISAPGKNAWSKDLMAGLDPIEHGQSADVAKLAPGTYDMKLVDDDDSGEPCVVSKVAVKAGTTLTLTKKMTAACK